MEPGRPCGERGGVRVYWKFHGKRGSMGWGCALIHVKRIVEHRVKVRWRGQHEREAFGASAGLQGRGVCTEVQ